MKQRTKQLLAELLIIDHHTLFFHSYYIYDVASCRHCGKLHANKKKYWHIFFFTNFNHHLAYTNKKVLLVLNYVDICTWSLLFRYTGTYIPVLVITYGTMYITFRAVKFQLKTS